eukprot:gene1068-1159_t
MSQLPIEYQSPESLRTLANFLRGQNGVKVKSGIEHEKRVDYFKGKRLVECIIEAKKWPKSIPRIESQEVAIAVANALIQANFFHRSEKVTGKKGYLRIAQSNVFDEKGYYTWMFAGNMMWSNIATFLVIAAVIGFTLLPIWPDAAKKVLWYCSVTFLLGTCSFCLIRALLFVVLWLAGYDFWIFPRLFDESLSFQDSFKPVYSFERGSTGQGYYRLGLIVAMTAFVYWALSQPTEFDGYIQAQKDFIDDLYSGKLLSDVPFDPKDGLDRQGKKVRSLEDLLRELEADEKSISETAANEDQEGSSEPVESVNLDEDGGNEEEETVAAEGDN